MNEWYYFGCWERAGHHVFAEGMRYPQSSGARGLNRFDGALPAQDDPTPYVATVSRLEGWGMTALAFWDYSVDSRSGSNSVIFAPSLDIAPADLLEQAMTRFPQVFGRHPKVVRLKMPNVADKRPVLGSA